MKNYLLLLLSFLIFKCGTAQENDNKDIFITNIRYHYGVVLPHHKSISYLVNDQVSAIELNFGFLPSRSRSWSKLYNQPEIGLGFYHGSLGNDEIFGNTNALFPYINFNLKDYQKGNLRFQTGFGIAHTKKHFHPTENYTNVAIGSEFNAFFKILLNGSYHFTNKWSANAGVGFQHLSNGSIKVPNKGLNMATASIGIQYHFNEFHKPVRSHEILNHPKLNDEIVIVWNNGIKQTAVKDDHKYYTTGLNLGYLRGINAKQKIGLGIDLFYDKSANRGKWDFDPQTKFKDRFSQAIFVSHELIIQRFSIVANVGAYTLFETKPEKPLYTRIGLKYKINEHFLASLGLKAHLGKADYIEWGIGYRLKTNNNEKR